MKNRGIIMITHLLRIFLARQIKPFIFKSKINHNIEYNQDNLGIYVHFPFCEKICDFCPYNKVIYRKDLVNSYINSLLKEIDLIGSKISKSKEISSIYFGGGSPALAGENLEIITNKIKDYFILKGNSGIEVHPSNINEKTIYNIKKANFDMISIGVQSFDSNCLKILGRKQENIYNAFKIINNNNFKTIDVDLIFGIPGQDEKSIKADFIKAVNLGATQISTYPFIDFSYTNNKYKPLNKKIKRKMLDKLNKVSYDLGFERNSIWTFIKKDSQHYSSITRDNFIGFGPSATTLLKDNFKINTFSVQAYINKINKKEEATALMLDFNIRTRALYWLFWSCYNIFINSKSFYDLFHIEIEEMFSFELFLGQKLNIIEKNNNGYNLTNKGIYYFHEIEQKYTHQYIDKTWKIAGKTPFPKKIILY